MMNSKFFAALALSLALFNVFTSANAQANALKKMSPADQAVEDLNFPDRPKYSTFLSTGSVEANAELISGLKSTLATLIAAQEFEGSRCDLKTPEMLFPVSTELDASTVLATAESIVRSEKTKEFRVSVKSRDFGRFNTTTFVRTNADVTRVVSYTTATCQGTRTMGLQFSCYVMAYCRAK